MKRTSQNLRASAAIALFTFLAAPAASAQCSDDYLEPNDSCGQATLVYGGYAATLTSLYQNEDYYQIHVPSGQDLTVSIGFSHSGGDLDLYLYDSGCGSLLAYSNSYTDDEELTWSNTGTTGLDVKVRVVMYAPNPDHLCNDYYASFSISTPTLCQDDNEYGNLDNDTCGDANLVFPDVVYFNFGVLDTDPDYYKMTVPAGYTLYVDLTFTHALGDIDLTLYDSSCSTMLAYSHSTTDDEGLVWVNPDAWDVEVKWNVYLYSGTCNNYHMVATLVEPGCGLEDQFEDNDNCSQAAALFPGDYLDLVVKDDDLDFFSFTVGNNQSLNVETFFTHANGDIDIRLWDGCGGSVIAYSNTYNDWEQITWNNSTGTSQTVVLEVYLYTGTCNLYDLSAGLVDLGPGSNFCQALPNSTGYRALMSATGSNSVAANNLVLTAQPLPLYEYGIFFYGPNAIQIPFGNGFRCVGGHLNRLPVHNSGAMGVLTHAVDYAVLPPTGIIVPGSTWNFQAYYRDSAGGGAQFNTSDGYQITFTP